MRSLETNQFSVDYDTNGSSINNALFRQNERYMEGKNLLSDYTYCNRE